MWPELAMRKRRCGPQPAAHARNAGSIVASQRVSALLPAGRRVLLDYLVTPHLGSQQRGRFATANGKRQGSWKTTRRCASP